MPTIPVNLGDVEAYENLPLGEYLGQIDKIVLKPAKEQGKFPQLMVTYKVIDGDQIGRASSEWLSLSPKAAFRLKKWFAKFGLDETENLDVDDETDELADPDLIGYQVIFKVYEDKPKPGETEPSVRTALVSVEDEVDPPSGPAPKAEATNDDQGDDGDEEPAEAAPRPARRAVAKEAKPARRQLR